MTEDTALYGRHGARPLRWWLRAWLLWARAWQEFRYLTMPAECAVCSSDDAALCGVCGTALRRETSHPFRAEFGADALMSVFGSAHLAVLAAGEYRDTLAAAILAYKNHGRTELATPLGRALAAAIAEVPRPPGPDPPEILLVPVPTSGAAWRRRGYDPVAQLLRVGFRERRMAAGMVVAPLLRVRGRLPWHTRHQKGLGRSARRANVRNTLVIKAPWRRRIARSANPRGINIIIVDDVMTTGATLQEAAKTLESWGVTVRCAVVLAATNPPDQGAGLGSKKGREKDSSA